MDNSAKLNLTLFPLSEGERALTRNVESLSMIYGSHDKFESYYESVFERESINGIYYEVPQKDMRRLLLERCGFRAENYPNLALYAEAHYDTTFHELKVAMTGNRISELVVVCRIIKQLLEREGLDPKVQRALAYRERNKNRTNAWRAKQKEILGSAGIIKSDISKHIVKLTTKYNDAQQNVERVTNKLNAHIERLNAEIRKFELKYLPEIQAYTEEMRQLAIQVADMSKEEQQSRLGNGEGIEEAG